MGISIWQLLIILAIVVLLFGAKRLRTLGGDLGTSVKGFKEAMKDGEKSDDAADAQTADVKGKDEALEGHVIRDQDKV